MNTQTTQTGTDEKKTNLRIVSDTEIEITRILNAPPELVYEAITTPEHVRNWFGCDIMKVVSCEMDVRVGGKWRTVTKMPDGSEHGFNGEYKEVSPPTRLARTENYEPIGPGHEMLATVTLKEEAGGKTMFTNRLTYLCKEDRDGHLGSGMDRGLDDAFNRLDAIVIKAKNRS